MNECLRAIVSSGSNVVEFQGRIKEFLAKDPIDIALQNWLKEEYGLGGRTYSPEGGDRYYASWDSKGVKVSNWDTDEVVLFSWKKIAELTRIEFGATSQLELF
jgi:hypothetical protein